ncbi:MAG: ferric reductase-like transmembrane domain-containing protein [Acidobacteriota bacterium]|nr:ferric reductase-like transmembrane domain-containing protein [Acidobacteriota bacterium]
MKSLPTDKRARKRFRYHSWVAFFSLAATASLYSVLSLVYPSPQSLIFRWSLATGYVGAALLAVTLSLGARKILRGRSNPVSTDLRRDIGIWCGILSIAHVIVGLNVHMKSWTLYFVTDSGGLRTDLFGLANYAGLAATLLLVVLLATSNDFSLTVLKSKRWKAIQRWNYVFAVLVALHSFLFIVVEKRVVPFVIILGAFAVWTLMIQAVGFQKRRQSLTEARATAVSE